MRSCEIGRESLLELESSNFVVSLTASLSDGLLDCSCAGLAGCYVRPSLCRSAVGPRVVLQYCMQRTVVLLAQLGRDSSEGCGRAREREREMFLVDLDDFNNCYGARRHVHSP